MNVDSRTIQPRIRNVSPFLKKLFLFHFLNTKSFEKMTRFPAEDHIALLDNYMDMDLEELLNRYDATVWERTAVFYETEGYLVTSRQRIERSRISKNETIKFNKERLMCLRYAGYGFQIEHLSEFPGIKSADVNILRHPITAGVAMVNGKRADLKSLAGANNIIKRAKYAVFQQKAELVLFEFPSRNNIIENTLRSLSAIGIHGYYYYKDESEYHSY